MGASFAAVRGQLLALRQGPAPLHNAPRPVRALTGPAGIASMLNTGTTRVFFNLGDPVAQVRALLHPK